MKLMLSLATLLLLGIPLRVWAEGALVVGCRTDGRVVWGYQLGEGSIDVAKRIAQQRCDTTARSRCSSAKVELAGDGAWIALAVRPAGDCEPFGLGYSANKVKAESVAISNCEKKGARDCSVVFVKRNQPHYTVTRKAANLCNLPWCNGDWDFNCRPRWQLTCP